MGWAHPGAVERPTLDNMASEKVQPEEEPPESSGETIPGSNRGKGQGPHFFSVTICCQCDVAFKFWDLEGN